MKYIIIAYKPHSVDYCMGCLMDSYSDDFEIISCESEEELVNKLAEVKSRNDFLRPSEDGYEVTVIRGEIISGDLSDKVEVLANDITEKKNLELKREEEAKKKEEVKRAKDRRKKEYLKLKKEFG